MVNRNRLIGMWLLLISMLVICNEPTNRSLANEPPKPPPDPLPTCKNCACRNMYAWKDQANSSQGLRDVDYSKNPPTSTAVLHSYQKVTLLAPSCDTGQLKQSGTYTVFDYVPVPDVACEYNGTTNPRRQEVNVTNNFSNSSQTLARWICTTNYQTNSKQLLEAIMVAASIYLPMTIYLYIFC